jgi:hypothetical protein
MASARSVIPEASIPVSILSGSESVLVSADGIDSSDDSSILTAPPYLITFFFYFF